MNWEVNHLSYSLDLSILCWSEVLNQWSPIVEHILEELRSKKHVHLHHLSHVSLKVLSHVLKSLNWRQIKINFKCWELLNKLGLYYNRQKSE